MVFAREMISYEKHVQVHELGVDFVHVQDFIGGEVGDFAAPEIERAVGYRFFAVDHVEQWKPVCAAENGPDFVQCAEAVYQRCAARRFRIRIGRLEGSLLVLSP